MKPPNKSIEAFEKSAAGGDGPPPPLELRLYVAGTSLRSTRAIQNAKEMCEENFLGRYKLEVIDILQQPKLAKDDDVLAVPILIRKRPPPPRRFIGDLSDRARVLHGLGAHGK